MSYIARAFATVLASASAATFAAPAPAPAPAAPESETHQRIVDEYLTGKVPELEAELNILTPKQLEAMPAHERADFGYIRQSMAECRPAWWAQCKLGKKIAFQPTVWRPINATYDPAAKGVGVNFNGTAMLLTLGWDYKNMDDAGEGEHGFTKGELNQREVWMDVGSAEAWMAIAMFLPANPPKTMISHYVELRGDLTTVYYSLPRARRWSLWLYCAAHTDHFAKMQDVNSRKAVAGYLVAEVVGHHEKYPSIALPPTLEATGAEAAMALYLKDWLEKNSWTLAEDKSIRDAFRTFASSVDKNVMQAGKVTLPGGMAVALDADKDAANVVKRDAWVKAAYDKAKH